MSITTADLFRLAWPRHAAKHAARAASGPVDTAQRWMRSRYRPNSDTLLKMVQQSKELRAELVRLCGEWDAETPLASGAMALPARADARASSRLAESAQVERRVGDRRRG